MVSMATLLRRAARTSGPEKGLAAIRALRVELEALERHHVATAISEGWSWTRVAEALGVTKQAAHKKHAREVRALTSTDPRQAVPTDGRVVVTAEARNVVRFARDEARAQGMTSVGTEHLLLGILRTSPDDPAVLALTGCGVTLDGARSALSPTLAQEDHDVARTSQPTAEAARASGVSALARLCLEDSLREAVKRAERHLGTEHLLLALLAREEGGATRTLEKLGVAPAGIRRRLLQREPGRGPR
jgi:hypothetical protein